MIPICQKDRYKTSFVTQHGHWHWKSIPLTPQLLLLPENLSLSIIYYAKMSILFGMQDIRKPLRNKSQV